MAEDLDGVWEIFHAVVQSGDTYDYPSNTTKSGAQKFWIDAPQKTFVACKPNGDIAGTYFIKPNRVGNGSHVANAAFMVHPNARGLGAGKIMGLHAIQTARSSGYVAMQFNLVVSVNKPAVSLWQKLGFDIIGTLPKAFHHSQLGYVDAYIMYQVL